MNRKRINPTRSEGVDGNTSELVLADVRGHIWAYKGTFKQLAIAANLNEATISNLAHGITTYPRFQTLLRIMEAIGKSEAVIEAFRSEKPVSLKQALRKNSVRIKLKKNRADKVHPHRVSKVPVRASQQRASVH